MKEIKRIHDNKQKRKFRRVSKTELKKVSERIKRKNFEMYRKLAKYY